MTARWQPSAPIENLQQRSEILWKVREFFRQRGICEVQTPVVGSHTVTDINIESVRLANGNFLQTSAEYFLKRLLAAGMPSCYQLGPVFREGEVGRWHNPEFTMLEWYRLGFSPSELRQEVKELIELVLGPSDVSEYSLRDFLFNEFQVDCYEETDQELHKVARANGFSADFRRADVLDFLYSAAIENRRESRYFVVDFPSESCALAEVREIDGHLVADRFEMIVEGLEIANGYNELRDPIELKNRMEHDQRLRRELERIHIERDKRLLAAMEWGLPRCSGVAVGLDRLVALSLGANDIQQVLPFTQSQI
ncbi:MAG: EF-P lysine aminoacylase GenX [Gammaproteobacteria bacterium]|nr:EF-P lysine aminoacylase GenX [Gammaproteobacteria bacterium]MYC24746.1 EF-P lysine aminoacylase GenX [Gammaproteobacteria bacterium]